MPYGTPEETSRRTYRARAISVESVGEYKLMITCDAETDNMAAPEVAALFQKFVDHLSTSPDFTVTATRTKEFVEQVTPTA
ncbi:hypothetical protein HUT18_07505 [Streptomyces sp. NA04227]|uniref:hypothetical protein n=1 Tax=Streptomyces sp. NA04227 TaxID=2742136 RepID=UPI001591B165|nr:hypothetical protein [Streptomyces sp. NA04227]QKW06270.1 hypothetical protein HUT18_07505 [Streptomyces sp. NA04227]